MRKNKIQFQKGLSLMDFLKDYGTKEQCFEALVKLRWLNGFECPKCEGKTHCCLKSQRSLFQCNACNSQTSITAGTIYHSNAVCKPLSRV